MISNDEYPFWARWYVNRTLESDITDVDYVIQEYDPDTDAFVTVDSGNIATRDARGRWIAPFTFPTDTVNIVYYAEYTPNGGDHPVLSEEVTTDDGVVFATQGGAGTEEYSGCVKDKSGAPIEGALVKAVFYGTVNTAASDLTDINGDFTLTGLYDGVAYTITANADGFTGKIADKVVI